MSNASPVTIFLDLDGVIADFDTHALSEGKILPSGKTDYDSLTHEWWKTMPAFRGAKAFYDELKTLAPVKFLTGPVPLVDCFSGKAQWVSDFTKKGRWSLKDLIICASGDKQFLARPSHILVDDREKNIEAWEKAGGTGILHKGDFEETLANVKKEVARLNYKSPQHGLFDDPGL